MCGACGRSPATDGWSVVLSTRRSRWEAATAINDALRDSGHPSRVMGTAGGWMVRSPTGATAIADTVTEIWRGLTSVHALSPDTLSLLERRAPTPAVRAVIASADVAVFRPRTTQEQGGARR